MIRKAIIVVLTLGALLSIAIEVFGNPRACRASQSDWSAICPVTLYLGSGHEYYSSDSDASLFVPYRYVCAVSHSWYTSVGYWCMPFRLYRYNDPERYNEHELSMDEANSEEWFHVNCAQPILRPGRKIGRVILSPRSCP